MVVPERTLAQRQAKTLLRRAQQPSRPQQKHVPSLLTLGFNGWPRGLGDLQRSLSEPICQIVTQSKLAPAAQHHDGQVPHDRQRVVFQRCPLPSRDSIQCSDDLRQDAKRLLIQHQWPAARPAPKLHLAPMTVRDGHLSQSARLRHVHPMKRN